MATATTRSPRPISARSPSTGASVPHTRPWRSSPLAGPAVSGLPPIISESDEEPDLARGLPPTRSPSSSSIASNSVGSLSPPATALTSAEGDPSTSSASLAASTGANGTSSQGHGSTQIRPHRSTGSSKSWSVCTSATMDDLLLPSRNNLSVKVPPRARTISHRHTRPASFPIHPIVPSSTIPQAYSRSSSRPHSDANTAKQSPSGSRDPSGNWMSSSPFGPAQTPKFSRLAMASPAVVMPLSAKEYRKQKTKVSSGKDKNKDKNLPTSSHRVTFLDSALSVLHSPNVVPAVKVSPSTSRDVRKPFSGEHSPDRHSQPQPQGDHPPAKQFPHVSRPSPAPKQKRPRSRPNTPPRSSPVVTHPPISPKSSAATFFSVASSASEDGASQPQGTVAPSSHSSPPVDPSLPDDVPPARPRPRNRRQSFPDRLSNGARLSLIEAMNRLSGASQSDEVNRLSVASQASGHTLFFDVVEEGKGQVVDGNINGEGGPRTPTMHTQSLENLSSTLARTGIEVVQPGANSHPGGSPDDGHKAKRNVRTVRISDTVQVSPAPTFRRRKLTKSRRGSVRQGLLVPVFVTGPEQGTEKDMKVQPQPQSHERRSSLLPWKSRGLGDSKAGAVAALGASEKSASTPTITLVSLKDTTTPTRASQSPSPVANGPAHVESSSKPKSDGFPKKPSSDSSESRQLTAPPDPELAPAAPPRKSRRYTFSFRPSSAFHRSKHEKSNTIHLSPDQNAKPKPKVSSKGTESGTESTSTSIHTITQGSQSTLLPPSPVYDLTTGASSGSDSGLNSISSVPMLRRVNTQEMEIAGTELVGRSDSTPSLITNGSSTTSSSVPRMLPSLVRVDGNGESATARPSPLQESFMDTSEDDLQGAPRVGRMSRMPPHRRHGQSPLARTGAEEDERYLRPSASAILRSRPGTSDSTATETSGSYASFGTVPFSTTSSSCSESPPPVMVDKRARVLSESRGHVYGDVRPCAMCGHRPMSPPAHELEQRDMHPMFTVPLVTVPASAMANHPRSILDVPPSLRPGYMGRADARAIRDSRTYSCSISAVELPLRPVSIVGARDLDVHRGTPPPDWRHIERRATVPVPAGPGIPPMRHDQNQRHMHVTADANASSVTMTTSALTRTRTTVVVTDMTATTVSPLSPTPQVLSPPKVTGPKRPQTAPPGTGEAALKFIEEVQAMRARQGSVDVSTGDNRSTKQKSKESKLKAVLKGLLRR